MSVATEITRLNKAKSDLKTSINNKLDDNQTKITDETIDTYSAFVDSIKQGADLVVMDYYEDDDNSKKEKIKSLFTKEDGTFSAHQLVKPCILLAPAVEPTNTTSIYTKCQWVCSFGDTESKLINEATNERSITYDLIFSSVDKGLTLTYNDRDGTITYKWLEAAIEVTHNKITKIGTPDTINDEHYPSEKAVYDYVNEKAVQPDYNQNDSTASDYIKNRPFYDLGLLHETLLDLTSPSLSTWGVCKTFKTDTDATNFMDSLKNNTVVLTINDLDEDCVHKSEGNASYLSHFNFPSDLYDATNSTPYALEFSSLGILFVNCTDNESNYVILYYMITFTDSELTDQSIQKLLLTGYKSELKQIQDKFIYSIVDTSDKDFGDFDPYGENFQQDFVARNSITDLSTKPTIDPKPSMVLTPSGLYLVTHTWRFQSDNGNL